MTCVYKVVKKINILNIQKAAKDLGDQMYTALFNKTYLTKLSSCLSSTLSLLFTTFLIFCV